MQHIIYTIFASLLIVSNLSAQKVLQIEKVGSAKTKKIFIGEAFEYRLKNSDVWLYAAINDFIVEEGLIALGDRYVHTDSIASIRYEKSWPRALGRQLFIFGPAWSAFALIGTTFDDDPESTYQWSDATVTGASMLTGFLLPKIFRYKKYRFGGRKRLRLVDLNFQRQKF